MDKMPLEKLFEQAVELAAQTMVKQPNATLNRIPQVG